MKTISKKIILFSCILLLASSFSVFATNVNKNDETKNTKEKNTEMILGKITNISAESVTIEVANRVKKEKKTADEKKAEKNQTNQTERKKTSVEDKYTLTGEYKTYNIASANFGRKAPENEKNVNTTEEKIKGEDLTYADYKVGDYIRITVNNDSPTIAKRLRYADQGFNYTGTKKGNYQGGYKGSYTGKTKEEKNNN